MPYGIPSRAEVKQGQRRVNAAKQNAERNRLYDEWSFARGEAGACGYDFPAFSEWLGESNKKDLAIDRHMNSFNDEYGYVD